MEGPWKKPWVILMEGIVLIQLFGRNNGCFTEEKRSLLDFKASYSNYALLPSWVNDSPKSNCCEWERVTCDPFSGHVTHLSLESVNRNSGRTGWGGCLDNTNSSSLNGSLFLSFKYLRYLSLSANCFDGFIWERATGRVTEINLVGLGLSGRIGKGLEKLQHLMVLSLSHNDFNGSITPSLTLSSTIQNLNQSHNGFSGQMPTSFFNMSSIRSLDLSHNSFSGHIPQSFFDSYNFLHYFSLSNNLFEGQSPSRISRCSSLNSTNLSNNHFAGYIDFAVVWSLSRLRQLDFFSNALSAKLSPHAIYSKGLGLSSSCHADNIYRINGIYNRTKLLRFGDREFYKDWWNAKTVDEGLREKVATAPSAPPATTPQPVSIEEECAEVESLRQKFNNNLFSIKQSSDLLMRLQNEDNGSKSTLKRLETLDFSFNNFKENIMEFLYSLISLRKLILAHNKIGGLFPSKELSVLCNLKSLDLSFNDLSGSLTTQGPFSLGNLTSLQTLDLSHNSLSGNIPEPLLARLSSLEHLSLCFNNFEGLFSLNILANQSKLKVLQIGHMSSKTFQVQTENIPWNASFQLEDLEIFSCKLNLPTRTFPSFLSSQNALRRVDLSEANLAGTFPNSFFMNKPRLKYMFLSKNSFVGSFELPVNQSQQMNQLYTLDISNNLIEGELPTNMGFFFPFLDYLDVSSNRFDGSIPSSIGEMSTLTVLDLSYNNFSGNVPKHFFKGCISLQSLLVDNNNFNGAFPSFVRSPNLTRITASRNNFEGQITEEMCELIRLLALDLSYNNFSGALPSCLNMPSAGLISLQGNSLTGTIPEALLNGTMRMAIDLSNNKLVWVAFKILDLSQNNFTGSVPSCFNSTTFASGKQSLLFGFFFNPLLQLIIKGLSLSYNTELLEIITVLDLSSNQLTGEIPDQIGDLSGLHALNLSHNHLEGPIPTSFHNLQSIESMDLSNNSLSGEIPLQLEDLHYLSVFNVCYNNLSGKAPNQGQFGTFDESSYRGNQYLKWGNSNRGNATLLPPPPNLPSGGDNDDSVIDFTSFCWSSVASFVTVLLTFVTILWINPYWRRVWFYFMEELLFKCFGWFLEDAFY
ncbi:hypothetical protein HN51_044316 [Arachis hypogaea]